MRGVQDMRNPFKVYRFWNKDGTSKDWAIGIDADNTVVKRWGRSFTKLQTQCISVTFPTTYVADQITKKTSKGYVFYGEFMIDDEGNFSRPMDAVSEPKKAADKIYWRLRISPMATTEEKIRFIDQVKILAKQCPDNDWVSSFTVVADDTVMNSAAGYLAVENGVTALLFLMAIINGNTVGNIALSLAFGAIDVTHLIKNETNALAYFGATLDSVRNLAEDLNLLEKPLNLAFIDSTVDDLFL
jgi:hypothetical protein